VTDILTEVIMPAPRDPQALLAAARLYYVENRSQADIAAELGTSRSNVSRMLTEAQRQGIVEIRIVDPSGRSPELEAELATMFGLADVRVALRGSGSSSKVQAQVGDQAAQLLLDRVKDSMTVALSWGHALQSMVYAATADHDYAVTLVQLVGGLSSVAHEISGAELVRELAVRLGASYRLLHAPAALGSSVARQALMAEPSIATALGDARQADIAFVGVGTPGHGSSAAVLASLGLSPDEEKAFWDAEPVGDIAARYYNASGQPIRGSVEDRIVAVTLEDLARIPNVVGVAHGRAKTPGVLGALRGRLVDSLVCDETLARSLVSEGRALAAAGIPPKGSTS
jgi:DNA-binding transcriptional regulator LsrR (DeoR family)